ncbi:uncharacterized protein SPSK_09307 [Sporothrix schenckii 1099-18]|uniref:Asl1-like glycosyl hydrolase catalytic domain-containing protein n=2 Tax=Sporothrix schenckii TaxID=29908 RepID=U7PZ74_SPOS1|nr:uncharacterized protein SPSK_09307 [Sporothrix schenckii 1099-18]ERT00035.1 hypothetical protein HMPREF1624_03404 [Sporothrix schenckii ATCC 58251]KJR85538.1 hypothetical protein SPSK_09307 [Sporothrix schenckii 1099-18]
MMNTKIVALVASLLAQQAVALNAHRHAHNQYHVKKAVEYVNDVVTVTDWTIVTVYEDGSPAHTTTTAPKAIYKGAHTERLTSTSTSAKKTSSTKKTRTTHSTSSSSSSYSTSSSTSSSSSTSTSIATPTTLVTSTKVSSSSTSTSSISSAKVQAAAAQAQLPTTSILAAVLPTTSSKPSSSAAAVPTTASSSSSAGRGARGLAYNSGDLLTPLLGSGTKCSWSYNWGQIADASAPESLEFVPMLWAPTHSDGWSDNAAAAIAKGATSLLSFNECDNVGQCNMDPASAASAHIELMNPFSGKARISTPAITNSNIPGEGVDWLKSFVSACNGQCAFDFCAAHWYSPPDTSDFLNHLVAVHEACGKPVWITEFAPTGSDEEISAFLATVMKAMDTDPTYSFVERYSYFMAATGSLLSSSTTPSSYGSTFAYE